MRTYSLLAIILLLMSCKNSLDKTVSTVHYPADIASIKSQDNGMYASQDFTQLETVIDLFKLTGQSNNTTTYREILDSIKAKRQFNERQYALLQAKYNAELKQYNAALRSLLNDASLNVFAKGVKCLDEYNINKAIEFKYTIANNSREAISAVKGDLTVKDVFGDELETFDIKCENLINPGTNVTAGMLFDYDSLEPSEVNIVTTDIKKLKFIWQPKMIVFASGKVMNAPDEPVKPGDM
jgi:hypothetical protein